MGYTLTDLATNSDASPECTPICEMIGGTKFKATFSAVTNGQDGATHMLVTDPAPDPALYRIKLWAFNDLDKQTGTVSDASAPVATYSEFLQSCKAVDQRNCHALLWVCRHACGWAQAALQTCTADVQCMLCICCD